MIGSAIALADEVINIGRDGRLPQHTASGIADTIVKSVNNELETRALRASSPQKDLCSGEQVTSLQDLDVYARDNCSQGDVQVYRYYVSKIGRRHALLFLACCTGLVLGLYIPRKSCCRTAVMRKKSTDSIFQKSGSHYGPKPTSQVQASDRPSTLGFTLRSGYLQC